MSPKLDQFLCKTYPKLFADRHKSPIETCMCWGFDCDDGWFWIIHNLCECIQRRIDHTNPSPEQVVVDQVKEKFGTLRFYFHGGDDAVYGMVQLAEWLSNVTCEACGNTDTNTIGSTTKGWIKTCCKECVPKVLSNYPSNYGWKSHKNQSKAYERKKAIAARPKKTTKSKRRCKLDTSA